MTLARNTLFNIVGQLVPLLVGIAAVPVVARYLEPARFGLLGLIWAIHGYLGLLDLGLGRATTKLVAELLERRDWPEVRRVATGSVIVQTIMGSVGGGALALATPVLVESVLGVPGALRPEARAALYALAASIPLVVLSLSLRALLEAAQRFDLVNLVRMPTSAAVFAVPAVAAPLGAGLPEIVLLLLGVRIITSWVTAVLVRRALPEFRWGGRPGWSTVVPLIRYGGWVTVSATVNPIFAHAERFILAGVAGVAAVAYYIAPYEAVTRLLIFPVSLTSVLFPLFSSSSAAREGSRLGILAVRAHRAILVSLAPPLALLFGFSRELIDAWLGPGYASSVAVAQILLVGVFCNALAQVPSVYLLGQGRPDIPAKFHLVELPAYLGMVWVLVHALGAKGAALAWTARVTLDALLLWAAFHRIARIGWTQLLGSSGGRALGAVAALAGAAVALDAGFGMTLAARLLLAAMAAALAVWYAWRWVADEAERSALRELLTGRLARGRTT